MSTSFQKPRSLNSKGICRFLRGFFRRVAAIQAPCAARHRRQSAVANRRDFSCDPQTSKKPNCSRPALRGASCDFVSKTTLTQFRRDLPLSLRGFFDESQQFKLRARRERTATEHRGYSADFSMRPTNFKKPNCSRPGSAGAHDVFVSKPINLKGLPLSPQGFFDKVAAIQAPMRRGHRRQHWLAAISSCLQTKAKL